jgi:hypothetical protein
MDDARVLLLYVDRYYLIKQVYPFGLDLIASYLRQYGHDVTVSYPFLPETDAEANLVKVLEQTKPHVIGIGIRNLDTCMSCERYGDYGGDDYSTFYFLPDVKRIVDLLKRHAPGIPIVSGGGAVTISPLSILKYLGIEYGIVGEGEEPLRRFMAAFPDKEKISKVPDLVSHTGDYVINPRHVYRFKRNLWPSGRDKRFNYALETVGLPVQTKRGCNQKCSYCVEPIIEGESFLFRDIDLIIEELMAISKTHTHIRDIFFVDTEFNLPDLEYCSALVQRIIKEGLHQRFSFSSQFLPRPFNANFAQKLAEAGFSIILTCDSFANEVLEKNKVSYRQEDIIRTVRTCEDYGIGCTMSMVFGLPGETHETLDHSLEQMKSYPPSFLRRYEYTIGGRIYQGTGLCRLIERGGVEQHLYGARSEGYIEPYYFCSPEGPMRLKERIEGVLGYPVMYENRYSETSHQSLALAYLGDQGRWEEAISRFFQSDLPARSSIYEYFFRKLTEAERVDDAKAISQNLLSALWDKKETPQYGDQIRLIQFYLDLLK